MTERKPRKTRSPRTKDGEIVRLEDLAPPENVRGGVRKRLFGEETPRRPPRKPGGG